MENNQLENLVRIRIHLQKTVQSSMFLMYLCWMNVIVNGIVIFKASIQMEYAIILQAFALFWAMRSSFNLVHLFGQLEAVVNDEKALRNED